MDPSNSRKKDILRAVVREYLRTAEPVGSAALCKRYGIGCSSATVRNDLADLEEEGLLIQPHTSAGRIPSEDGYRAMVEEFIREATLAERQRLVMQQAMEVFDSQRERAAKSFARMVAELTGEAVVLKFGPDETMFAGLANLANKPESRGSQMLVEMSRALDEIENTMEMVRGRLTEEVAVFIGHDNPFGDELSGVFTRLDMPGLGGTTVGIVGPKRMDYEQNIALMRFLKEAEADDDEETL